MSTTSTTPLDGQVGIIGNGALGVMSHSTSSRMPVRSIGGVKPANLLISAAALRPR